MIHSSEKLTSNKRKKKKRKIDFNIFAGPLSYPGCTKIVKIKTVQIDLVYLFILIFNFSAQFNKILEKCITLVSKAKWSPK